MSELGFEPGFASGFIFGWSGVLGLSGVVGWSGVFGFVGVFGRSGILSGSSGESGLSGVVGCDPGELGRPPGDPGCRGSSAGTMGSGTYVGLKGSGTMTGISGCGIGIPRRAGGAIASTRAKKLHNRTAHHNASNEALMKIILTVLLGLRRSFAV